MANQALTNYIRAARKKGHSDDKITADLLAEGWKTSAVKAALSPKQQLPVPTPGASDQPPAVALASPTRGLEYIILVIALAVSAVSLGALLHAWVSSLFGPSTNQAVPAVLPFNQTTQAATTGPPSLAIAALIVSLPVFVYLFLRLRRSEELEPALQRDAARTRAVQFSLIASFLVGLWSVIYFIYSLMPTTPVDAYGNAMNAATSSIGGNFVHLVATLAIAGGIFYYCWRDEHQA